MWDSVIVLARVAILVYVGLLVVLAGCQRGMIYYPTRANEQNATQLAATDGLEPWRNAAGEIIGWRPVHEPNADVMLAFHGNAGFAAQRGYLVHGFAPRIAVYLFEYPGYGTRAGKPSEQTFVDAATDALKQLRSETTGKLFLAGESLGSGVAAHLAGAHHDVVDGIFLITPFNSLVDVAQSHYPIFPVRLLMRDRYESAKHLQAYRGPVAILLAGRDEVVPARFGQKLYDRYDGPKRVWVQGDRTHNTLDYGRAAPWWNEVAAFLYRDE